MFRLAKSSVICFVVDGRLPAIENQERKPYPSDLSDAEWLIIKPFLPTPKGFGHPVEVDLREILNAIFYVPTHRVLVKNTTLSSSPLHNSIWLLSKMAAQRSMAENLRPSAPSTATRFGQRRTL